MKKHDDSLQGTPVDAPAPPAPKRQKKPVTQERNLVVQHNLSQDNLAHAHKLGGLAAPSIAVVNAKHGMNNFGEVSLIAHHSLIDPKHVPVFDADIYSARHPRPRYRVNEKALKQFKAWLTPFAAKGGTRALYNVADKVNERGHQGVLEDMDAANTLKLAWLHENGVHVEPPMRQKPLRNEFAAQPAMRQFFAQHGFDHGARPGDDYYRKMSEAAKEAMEQHAASVGRATKDPDLAESLAAHHREHMLDDDGQVYFGRAHWLMDDAQKVDQHEVDAYGMHDLINSKVKELGEGKFHEWVKPKLQPLEGEAYLPKGQRKMRYDIDSVLKEMTRKVRGGENFNYGLGTARSGGAKKFRDVTGIQKDRHKIVPHEEFEAKKEENNNRLFKLVDKLSSYHSTGGGFHVPDALVYAIGDSYKRGKWIGQTLKENGFEGVPPHLQQELGDFARDLREMPTEYFEAKPQRAVDIGEFKAAVVPHDVRQETLDILRHHGINHVERYERKGTEEDTLARAQAVERAARAHDLMLSEPEIVFDDLAKAEDQPGVALVTAYNDQGELLLGRRRDNKKWTLPGGHLNPGEDPREGAERELHEETGLRPTSISFLKDYVTSTGVRLHCFSAYVHGEPHSHLDPDDEVEEWKFVDVSEGLPSRFYNHMHGPDPESGDNLVANIFDLGKAETLEKMGAMARVAPFNPDESLDPDEEHGVAAWQLGTMADTEHPDRAMVPYMSGPARTRALQRLGTLTKIRRGPNGERQFLLHRGTSHDEHDAAKKPDGTVSHEDMSSWTPSYRTAQNFASEYQFRHEERDPGTPLSAWISENDIHAIPRQWGKVGENPERDVDQPKERGSNVYSGAEHEVIVGGHTSQHATTADLAHIQNPLHDLDHRITQRKWPLAIEPKEQEAIRQTIPPRPKPLVSDPNQLSLPNVKSEGEPWKHPLGVTCSHGLKVFLVDGMHVRNHFDSDYDQGGNGFRYKFIPKDEIWVDMHEPRAEIPLVVQHECSESEKMRSGESYDKAHGEAKRAEDSVRHRLMPGEVAKAEVDPPLPKHPEEYPRAGTHTSGLKVRGEVPNTASIGASFDDGEYDVLPGIREVPISHFSAAKEHNYYSAGDFRHVDDLSNQIGASKEIAPLIVVHDHDPRGPYILEGGHRLSALHQIGAKTFPALVVHHHHGAVEKAELQDLGHGVSDEYGVHFETGHPVSVKFVRGTTPSPNFGETYQQHIEPAGRYMVHNPDPGDLARGWEKGEVHFKNPLVLKFNTSGEVSYDEGSWKARLHRALGAKGPHLSRKVAGLGHDGIVTVDGTGYTREIVDLTHLRKSEFELEKAEDEVGKLLAHPDPTERRMALRLNTTKAQHVIHAALDPEPSVHEAAIDHPLFGDVEALHLMEAKEGHDGQYPARQQEAFLSRSPRVKPFHVSAVVRNAYSVSPAAKERILAAVVRHPALSPANVRMLYRGYGTTHVDRRALLAHPAAPVDVLEHAMQHAVLFPSPDAEELAGKAAEHPNLSPAAREAIVRQVGDAAPAHAVEVAQRALAHGPVSRELVDHLFLQRMLKPSSHGHALVGALLRGPTATPEDVDRALTSPHPAVWLGALGAPALQPKHMDQLVAQAHAAGDRDALKRMSEHPHFGSRHLQALVAPAAEPIQKAEGPHDPGDPHQMDPIVAEAWVSRMRHAFAKAPWVAGTPKYGVLHNSLVAGDPEAFAYVREKLDPAALAAREDKVSRDRREERQTARYEGQAVELDDHIHKPDHQQRKVAGGKDVWLYHGTSSKHLPKILRHGLHPQEGAGKIQIDPRETPGVYLTTRADGGPGSAQAYAQRAAGYFGGDPVVLRVKHPFDTLQPDEDDADIASGRHQFKTDHVPPHAIMEVNGERVRRGLAKSELAPHRSELESMVREPVVQHMLGFDPAYRGAFRAARFLAGGAEVPAGAMRAALYAEDGNLEAAALRAYGFDISDENLRALRAVQEIGQFEKDEEVVPAAQQIVAAHPEGEDVAAAVRRAYEHQFVFQVQLGGKHSKGSMLAHDYQTDTTWLLKSGSGGAGVAAGADQDPSNPNAREAAWYHIAEDWGVEDAYPRAELVMIDGHPYAAMRLLAWSYKPLDKRREKDPGIARRVLQPYLSSGKLHQWAVMDYVLGNPDSHGQNVMSEDPRINLERRRHTEEPHHVVVKDEDVKLIDHGSAFAGPGFDPAHDKASFVPYYLRAWASHDTNFNKLPAEEKLRHMPRVDRDTAARLKTWLDGLSADRLRVVCERYDINAKPTLDRLQRLRALAETRPIDEAVDRLWAIT